MEACVTTSAVSASAQLATSGRGTMWNCDLTDYEIVWNFTCPLREISLLQQQILIEFSREGDKYVNTIRYAINSTLGTVQYFGETDRNNEATQTLSM